MIDSGGAEEYDTAAINLYMKWNALELKETITSQSKFFTHFREHIAMDLRAGSILPVHRAAGVGHDCFYNNTAACMNLNTRTE